LRIDKMSKRPLTIKKQLALNNRLKKHSNGESCYHLLELNRHERRALNAKTKKKGIEESALKEVSTYYNNLPDSRTKTDEQI